MRGKLQAVKLNRFSGDCGDQLITLPDMKHKEYRCKNAPGVFPIEIPQHALPGRDCGTARQSPPWKLTGGETELVVACKAVPFLPKCHNSKKMMKINCS